MVLKNNFDFVICFVFKYGMTGRHRLRFHFSYNLMHSLFICNVVFFISTAMDRRGSQGWTRVLLKGQMRYIADIDSIIFLCSPL